MILHNLFVKQLPDCILNTFCTSKLSKAHGFTKGVSVDALYLLINDIFEANLPYVQSRCWRCQSNTSELNVGE